jgi:hypothetical protein
MLTKDQVIAALEAALPASVPARETDPVAIPTGAVIAALELLGDE